MENTKIFSRDFLLVTAANVFIALNFYLLLVLISSFAMEQFNATPSQGGLASGIFVIGALIARIIAGKWIEIIGRKNTLYIGVILGVIMALLYFPVNSMSALLLVRFFHGISYGIAGTATATIASSLLPPSKKGEGLGYFMLSVTLATAIGPFIGILLEKSGSFDYVLFFCFSTAVVGFIFSTVLRVPEITLTSEQKNESRGFNLSDFFEKKALSISLICGAVYFCYSTVFAFVNSYAKEINLSDTASFFFVVIAIVIFISRPLTGKLFDSKGENSIMYPGILILVLGMILLGLSSNGIMLLSAGALIGIGVGIVQSGGQAVAVILAPPHRIGMANSTFFACLDFSVGTGPFVLGLLIPLTGYRNIYLIMGSAAFLSIFLYHNFHGKKAELLRVKN